MTLLLKKSCCLFFLWLVLDCYYYIYGSFLLLPRCFNYCVAEPFWGPDWQPEDKLFLSFLSPIRRSSNLIKSLVGFCLKVRCSGLILISCLEIASSFFSFQNLPCQPCRLWVICELLFTLKLAELVGFVIDFEGTLKWFGLACWESLRNVLESFALARSLLSRFCALILAASELKLFGF